MKLYLGTNTKMYKTIENTSQFLERLKELTLDLNTEKVKLFVIPSFTALQSAHEITKDTTIMLGAQNMCWEEEGQYTGEISPIMLKEIGINLVEIGHSERRQVMGETDEMEQKKVTAAVKHNITALLCIGETAQDKSFGISDNVLSIQIKKGLYEVKKEQLKNIWIAYEPVWAIGVSGIPATPAYVKARHMTMRKTLVDIFGVEGEKVPLLYGGSVNIKNAEELIKIPEVNGLFIGRSAWDAEDFNRIIRKVINVN